MSLVNVVLGLFSWCAVSAADPGRARWGAQCGSLMSLAAWTC